MLHHITRIVNFCLVFLVFGCQKGAPLEKEVIAEMLFAFQVASIELEYTMDVKSDSATVAQREQYAIDSIYTHFQVEEATFKRAYHFYQKDLESWQTIIDIVKEKADKYVASSTQ